jgi:hypothetical protein
VGGTGPRAGCSPRLEHSRVLEDESSDESRRFDANVKSMFAREMPPVPSGGGLCRPLSLRCERPGSEAQPWRERPRVLAASVITSAASAGHSRHGCSSVMMSAVRVFRVWTPPRNHRCFLLPSCHASCRGTSERCIHDISFMGKHSAHQIASASNAAGSAHIPLDRESNETPCTHASSSENRPTTPSIRSSIVC